jgi:two-component system sporulation sensor kinase A
VTVRFERTGPSPSVQADRVQIRQVWLNLATNALEAMGGRGTLRVGWFEGESGHVVVEFVDDGPGIATEDLSRVGQPFFTTKQGGTGLGLAIAQRIVERHGGMLSLENAAPRGAVVRVTLPGAVKGTALAA